MYKLNKKNKIILTILIIIIFFAITYYIYAMTNDEEIIPYNEDFIENKIEDNTKNKKEEKNVKIIIHVAGSVFNPGIVELEENTRVSDVINAAGGITEDADLSEVNLASIVEDGMKIYIPSIKDKEENKKYEIQENAEISDNVNQKTKNKININTANQAELETLPGVGTSTALKIIAYRKENGKFNSIEDIKNVKGIGTSKYENIKELICVK